MKTCFTLEGYNTAAGLTHQTHNLNCILSAAYQRRLVPLIPRFRLCGRHNRGRELLSDLSTYYDYDRLTINGTPQAVVLPGTQLSEELIERVTITPEAIDAVEGVLWSLEEFRDVRPADIHLPYRRWIIDTAETIARRLGRYTCVHVRRGDRVAEAQREADTRPANVFDKIQRCGLTTVYIMTDEDPVFFRPLIQGLFDIRFYCDFPELKAIEDNYLLFCVENEIMSRAHKRVSTFRTAGWPRDGYYDCHLTDSPGWQ